MRADYVTVDDGDVAFAVVDGPGSTLLFHFGIAPGLLIGEVPLLRPLFDRLRCYRLVLMDCRGTGRSDSLPDASAARFQHHVAQVVAVAEAAGLEDAWLCGYDGGGAVVLAAAGHLRRRVRGVAMLNPWYVPGELLTAENRASWDAAIQQRRRRHGQDALLSIGAPSVSHDPSIASQWAQFEQLWGSRAQLALLMEGVKTFDVRPYLADVDVPVLQLNFVDHPPGLPRPEVPGARIVALRGVEHLFFLTDALDMVMDEVDDFVLGERSSRAASRALRAVVFADLVDSTARLVGAGDRSWRGLLEALEGSLREEVRRRHGRVIKTTGDGALAVFESVIDAVRCAADLCRIAGDLSLEFRCGVHVGDVELRGDDVTGLTVHVASRLESLAEPGSVFVSRACADAARGSQLRFDGRGLHSLKGIDGKWEVLALRT